MDQNDRAIELDGVGVWRGGRWILRDVNWQVERGRCAAILGPNGSGKSTLARIVAGHLWPTAGDCRVLGQRFGEVDLAALRKSIRLLQPAGPYETDPELSALEVVLTGFFGTVGLYDPVTDEQRRDAEESLQQVGLERLAEHSYGTLSSGERVRSLMARALVQRPAMLLLDEPTAGLDLLGREQVLGTIQSLFENGTTPPTVILITHHVEELPPATSKVLVLSDGAVAAEGAPEEVLEEKILSKVYGCPVKVRMAGGRYYVEVHPGAWRGLVGRSAGSAARSEAVLGQSEQGPA